jgi:c(7)-type cytochrome triheme protein
VPPGFTLEFDGNGEGRVIFEEARHAGPGIHCSSCHVGIFYVSRNSYVTRAGHTRHQYCFVCHDGERAFADRQNCKRCHEEEPAAPQGAAPKPPPQQASMTSRGRALRSALD